MGFDSKTARMAGFQAAASMTPEARTARARKASAAAVVANAKRREARAELAEKTRRKMAKKGHSEAEIAAELDRLGLVVKYRGAKDKPSPSDEELEGYYEAVDAKFPGLAWSARKRQALAMMNADIARLERNAK